MIKPVSDNIAKGHMIPIRNGSRPYQLMLRMKWILRKEQNPFNRQKVRLNQTYIKMYEHLQWWFEKKIPDFKRNNFHRIKLMIGNDRVKENCDYVLIYDPVKKPVLWYKDDPTPSKNVLCVKCDWIMARSDIEQLGWLKECPNCNSPIAPQQEDTPRETRLHQECLDCDALITMHRNGHIHCRDCEEEDCIHNQHPYNPEPDNEEEQE